LSNLHPASLRFFRAGSTEQFEIPFVEENFPHLEFPHPSQAFIMPIVHHRNNEVRAIGTRFSISDRGLVVTARHVVEEIQKIHASARADNNEFCGVLSICAEPTAENPRNFVGGILPIVDAWTTNYFLDIALMLVELPVHDETKQYLPIGMMALSPGIPKIGQACIGLGYTLIDWKADEVPLPEISQSYNAARGTLEEIYFPRRDQRLDFPCFLTDARFDLGMSGGPIISATGQVCGVICSGTELSDSTMPRISYGSLIGPALAISLKMTSRGLSKEFFLWDLVRGGAVFCDATYAQIAVKRGTDTIEIDFGGGAIIRNQLG
jgi:hypothetical protein